MLISLVRCGGVCGSFVHVGLVVARCCEVLVGCRVGLDLRLLVVGGFVWFVVGLGG